MGGCASLNTTEARLIEHITTARQHRVEEAKIKARALKSAPSQDDDLLSMKLVKSHPSTQYPSLIFSDRKSTLPIQGLSVSSNDIAQPPSQNSPSEESRTQIQAQEFSFRTKNFNKAETQQLFNNKPNENKRSAIHLETDLRSPLLRPTTAKASALGTGAPPGQPQEAARIPRPRMKPLPNAGASRRPQSAAHIAAGGAGPAAGSDARRALSRGARPQSAYAPGSALSFAAGSPSAGAERLPLPRPKSALVFRPRSAAAAVAAPRTPSPAARPPSPAARPRPLSAAARGSRPASASAPQLTVAADGAMYNVNGRCRRARNWGRMPVAGPGIS